MIQTCLTKCSCGHFTHKNIEQAQTICFLWGFLKEKTTFRFNPKRVGKSDDSFSEQEK